MKRSKFTDEQILAIVKEGEAGRKVEDLCHTHGITEQTYYRWKAKYSVQQVVRENRFALACLGQLKPLQALVERTQRFRPDRMGCRVEANLHLPLPLLICSTSWKNATQFTLVELLR